MLVSLINLIHLPVCLSLTLPVLSLNPKRHLLLVLRDRLVVYLLVLLVFTVEIHVILGLACETIVLLRRRLLVR